MTRADDIGVVFDMDGVLVDSAEMHLRSWRQLAEECGATVERAQFDETFGRQNRDIIPLVFGETREDRVRAMADRKEELYRELVRKNPPIVPGAVELIRNLQRAGVRLAVGSSAPRANVDLILEAMQTPHPDLISVIVSGDEITKGKPDPAVFVACCERLGLPPSRCVVIEDAPAGIQAARAAGAKAVAVLMYHPREAFEQADLVADRLLDLSVAGLRTLADGASRSAL